MPRLPFFLFISLACLSSSPATSAESALSRLQEQAQGLGLAGHPEWLRLLHYPVPKPIRKASTWRSRIDDAGFFLAADGASSPEAELKATLQALFTPPAPDADPDAHPRCRFVARVAWLEAQLPIQQTELPALSCHAFRQWHAQVGGARTTLIFPAYYLNSPSSMFGHTLLRLDPEQTEGWSEWLSVAVNFGAQVNPQDSSLFYAFKGLTGGYPGRFNVAPYYQKIQEYNRDEDRDIWEYPLDLTAQETQRLVLHLWELREVDFAYYFFDENCSYRVLELLEIARPGLNLTETFGLTAIPIDTVRAVQQAGLIRSAQYRPAKANVLKHRLAQIPPDLQARVIELSSDPDQAQAQWFKRLDQDTQARLIEAAYKHLRHRQIGKARDPDVARRSYRLLTLLNAHAKALPDSATQENRPSTPESGHGSRRLSFGRGSDSAQQFATLGLRLSLHSLEENAAGFLPGAQINIGHLEMRVDDSGQIDLHRFDLIDIFSLTPRDRFFQPWSWKVFTGLERQFTAGREHRVAQLSGGFGVSRSLWRQQQIFSLLTARIEHNGAFANLLEPALGLHAGLLQLFSGHGLRMELSGEKFANGQARGRAVYQHNVNLSRQQSLNLRLEREWQRDHQDTSWHLRYQHYY